MNKRIFLQKYKTQIHVGSKLFFAGLALALGNFILAGMVMLMPGSWVAGILAVGDTLTEEEKQAALLKKIENKIQEVVDKASKGVITEEALNKELEKVNKIIKGLTDDNIKKLAEDFKALSEKNDKLAKEFETANEIIGKQGAEIKKLKETGVEDPAGKKEVKTFLEALREAFTAQKKELGIEEVTDIYGKRLSILKSFQERGSTYRSAPITVKAAVDMFEGNINGNYVNFLRLTELDPNRVSIPLTIYPHVVDVFAKKTISRPNMALLVVGTYFDGAATKAEGAAAGQSSFLLTTVSFPAFFISTYFNLSDETLDDLNEVMEEIAMVAPDKILDKIDGYILGTAGDDITAIKGIRTAAKSTAYVSALTLGSIGGAYIVDVIDSAKLQVENAKYRPNVIYMNPLDYVQLKTKKNSFNDSLNDRRVSYGANGEPTSVCGLAIIRSTAIPADQMLILDNKQPVIGRRRDMTIEIGYNGTDFVEGQKTVILKTRLAFGVRDPLGIVWVNGIAAAAAALNQL